ncbi:response regulator [Chloroflexota bacterium]
MSEESINSEELKDVIQAIRVLIVDDHQVVRSGLRHMLNLEDDIRVVGEASNAEESFTQAEVLSPDVILMDIKMPGMNGVEATKILKERHPSCNIIMLTLYDEHMTQAIEAGASGYLLKDVKREELSKSIREVHRGQSSIHPALTRTLFTEFAALARDKAKHEPSLSEQQLAILRLVAAGETNRGIASQLFLSDSTVKREMRNLFTKLEANTRSEVVSEAYKKKLI